MKSLILDLLFPVTPSNFGVNRLSLWCKLRPHMSQKSGLQVYTFRYKVYTPSKFGVTVVSSVQTNDLGLSGLHVYTKITKPIQNVKKRLTVQYWTLPHKIKSCTGLV